MVLKDVRPIIAELVRLKKGIPLEIDVGRYLPEIRKNTHGEATRSGIKKALRAIEQAPAIDAVEVVRCKDCVFFWEYTVTHKATVEKADGDCSIRCLNDCGEQFNAVTKDDYCSLGKRSLNG